MNQAERDARRRAIDECRICDRNGLVEILPPTKLAHATCVRCPHDPHTLVGLKRAAQDGQASALAHRPRPITPPSPPSTSEPRHQQEVVS